MFLLPAPSGSRGQKTSRSQNQKGFPHCIYDWFFRPAQRLKAKGLIDAVFYKLGALFAALCFGIEQNVQNIHTDGKSGTFHRLHGVALHTERERERETHTHTHTKQKTISTCHTPRTRICTLLTEHHTHSAWTHARHTHHRRTPQVRHTRGTHRTIRMAWKKETLVQSTNCLTQGRGIKTFAGRLAEHIPENETLLATLLGFVCILWFGISKPLWSKYLQRRSWQSSRDTQVA